MKWANQLPKLAEDHLHSAHIVFCAWIHLPWKTSYGGQLGRLELVMFINRLGPQTGQQVHQPCTHHCRGGKCAENILGFGVYPHDCREVLPYCKKKKTKTWCQGLRASPLCSPFHLHSFGRETLTQRRWGGWPTYLWQLAELNWRLDTGTSAQNFRRVWAVFTDPNLEPGSRLLKHSRMVWLAGSCTVHKKAEILCSN